MKPHKAEKKIQYVDIKGLSSSKFRTLDDRLKQLKEEGKLPPVELDPETYTPYIQVDGKNYPIEPMMEREILETGAPLAVARGRVLIKQSSMKPRTKGGIAVISDVKGPKRGLVIGVGEDDMKKKKLVTSPCQVGDYVIFVNATEIKLEKQTYCVVPFEDILLKLKD